MVTLGFTEPYQDTEEGERVFDVTANGEALLDDFDLLRTARDDRRAITRRFTVYVSDGLLNLQFKASVGAAVISNIRVSGGSAGAADRAYLVNVLTTIAKPVLEATAAGQLHERLPVHDWELHRKDFTHYEAFARTLAGIAPWLELGPEDTPEGRLRARFIEPRPASAHQRDGPEISGLHELRRRAGRPAVGGGGVPGLRDDERPGSSCGSR